MPKAACLPVLAEGETKGLETRRRKGRAAQRTQTYVSMQEPKRNAVYVCPLDYVCPLGYA